MTKPHWSRQGLLSIAVLMVLGLMAAVFTAWVLKDWL